MPARQEPERARNHTGTRGSIEPRPERPIEPMGSYTFQEAAAYLQISKRALTRLVEAGRIGFVPINQRQRRILGRQLMDFLDRQARGPRR
jgi:excisionase family DNA binding protein